MIVSYAPRHWELQSWDRKLVMAESQTEDLNDRINGLISDNWISIFDSSDPKKIGRRGLISQTKMLHRAEKSLESAMENQFQSADWIVDNLTTNSSEDAGWIVRNITQAISGVLNDTTNSVSGVVEKNFKKNRDTMNKFGTNFLRTTISDMMVPIRGVLGLFNNTQLSMDGYEKLNWKSIDRFDKQLKVFFPILKSMIQRMQSDIGDVRGFGLDMAHAEAAKLVAEVLPKQEAEFQDQSGTIQTDLQNQISKSMDRFSKRNGEVIDRMRMKLENRLQRLSDTIDAVVEDAKAGISSGRKKFSEKMNASEFQQQSRESDQKVIRHDFQKLIQSILRRSMETASIQGYVVSDFDDLISKSSGDSWRKIHGLLSHGWKNTADGITGLVSSLDSAQSDARISTQNYQDQAEDVMVNLLMSLGGKTAYTSGALADLVDKIEKSKHQDSAAVFTVSGGSKAAEEISESWKDGLTGLMHDLNDVSPSYGDELDFAVRGGEERVKEFLHQTLHASGIESGKYSAAWRHHEKNVTNSVARISDILRQLLTSNIGNFSVPLGEISNELGILANAISNSDSELSDVLGSQFAQFLSATQAALPPEWDALNVWDKISAIESDYNTISEKESNGLKRTMLFTRSMTSEKLRDLLDLLEQIKSDESTHKETMILKRKSDMSLESHNSDHVIHEVAISVKDLEESLRTFLVDFANKKLDSAHGRFEVSRKETDIGIESLQSREESVKELLAVSTKKLDSIVNKDTADRDTVSAEMDKYRDLVSLGDQRYGQALDFLSLMKLNATKDLAQVKANLTNTLLSIPRNVSFINMEILGGYKLRTEELEDKIINLRDILASEENLENRNRLMNGLVVLEKLHAVQEGITDAIQNGTSGLYSITNDASETDRNLLGAMMGFKASTDAIFKNSRATISDSLESVSKQTAEILNGYYFDANGKIRRLANDAAQSAMNSAFELGVSDSRSAVRMRSELGITSDRLQAFQTRSSQVAGLHAGLAKTETEGRKSVHFTANWINQEILNLMHIIGSNRNVSSDSDTELDVLSRLGIVRIAVAEFLGLWHEFGKNLSKKLFRFAVEENQWMEKDDSAIEGVLRDLNRDYTEPHDTLNKLSMTISNETENFEIFFLKFFTLSNQTRGSIDEMNRDISNEKQWMFGMESQVKNDSKITINNIASTARKLLDDFDNERVLN